MATLKDRIDALATAIATKFNAIKPQLVPTGGATGQVLSKASATNNDTVWTTPGSSGGQPLGVVLAIARGCVTL